MSSEASWKDWDSPGDKGAESHCCPQAENEGWRRWAWASLRMWVGFDPWSQLPLEGSEFPDSGGNRAEAEDPGGREALALASGDPGPPFSFVLWHFNAWPLLSHPVALFNSSFREGVPRLGAHCVTRTDCVTRGGLCFLSGLWCVPHTGLLATATATAQPLPSPWSLASKKAQLGRQKIVFWPRLCCSALEYVGASPWASVYPSRKGAADSLWHLAKGPSVCMCVCVCTCVCFHVRPYLTCKNAPYSVPQHIVHFTFHPVPRHSNNVPAVRGSRASQALAAGEEAKRCLPVEFKLPPVHVSHPSLLPSIPVKPGLTPKRVLQSPSNCLRPLV